MTQSRQGLFVFDVDGGLEISGYNAQKVRCIQLRILHELFVKLAWLENLCDSRAANQSNDRIHGPN